jgi:very-short-patch-repair endonuclease
VLQLPFSQTREKGLGDEDSRDLQLTIESYPRSLLSPVVYFGIRSGNSTEILYYHWFMANSSPRIRGASEWIGSAAKRLRKRLTPAEKRLWQELRAGRLAGLKFRRQHPVGRFILDFYCPEYKLVIEVDGKIHETQMEYDAARTAQLELYGYKVLRFENDVVIYQIETVLTEILQAIPNLVDREL